MINIIKNIYERIRFIFFKITLRTRARFNDGYLKLFVGKYFFTYRIDSGDQQIMYLMDWNKYFQIEQKLIRDHVHSGDVVVDVGANLGFYTILLTSLVGPEGKIYSFEPSPKTFLQLSDNIRINKLSNVVVENLGCGNKEGEFKLKKDEKFSGMDHIAEQSFNNSPVETVNIVTLDNYFSGIQEPIKLIKIDTEGYESKVLLGAVETIKKYKPVLVVELSYLYLKESLEAVSVLEEFNYLIDYKGLSLENAPAGTNFVCRYRDM